MSYIKPIFQKPKFRFRKKISIQIFKSKIRNLNLIRFTANAELQVMES